MSKYKTFWIIEYKSSDEFNREEVYYNDDYGGTPVIERRALDDCQKRLDEALVYLKRARNTMSCYDDCDSLFSEEERCNCGTENDMHEIDTFLNQIKDEGE